MRHRSPERRAATLVRWYPRSWRERCGDEFAELLVADFIERPWAPSRTADVLRTALGARLGAAGLAGWTLDVADQARASVAAIGCATAIFVALAAGLWAQLTIGWQWSRPDAPDTVVAVGLMSVALLALLALGAGAVAAIVPALARSLRGPDSRSLRLALLRLGAAVALLAIGSVHFAHAWPGSGGHAWSGRGLLPGGLASLAWAATLSITSYWAHPAALSGFPASELAWMALAPLAGLTAVHGAFAAARRIELSRRALRLEALLARAAATMMVAFLAGAALWLLGGRVGPDRLFASGAIDIGEVAVMAAALLAAASAARAARRPAPAA
jgi:hypothetical protein